MQWRGGVHASNRRFPGGAPPTPVRMKEQHKEGVQPVHMVEARCNKHSCSRPAVLAAKRREQELSALQNRSPGVLCLLGWVVMASGRPRTAGHVMPCQACISPCCQQSLCCRASHVEALQSFGAGSNMAPERIRRRHGQKAYLWGVRKRRKPSSFSRTSTTSPANKRPGAVWVWCAGWVSIFSLGMTRRFDLASCGRRHGLPTPPPQPNPKLYILNSYTRACPNRNTNPRHLTLHPESKLEAFHCDRWALRLCVPKRRYWAAYHDGWAAAKVVDSKMWDKLSDEVKMKDEKEGSSLRRRLQVQPARG